MSFLAVVTADGGVPLFTRSAGQVKTKLPFATVGTLNGVHMFSRLRGSELKRIATPDEKIIYREYRDKIVLILITRNDASNDCHASVLLDNIFAAIAMIVGIDALLKPSDNTRLQKALVNTYPLIDALLNQLDPNHGTLGDMTLKADCLFAEATHPLQKCMDEFLDKADSLYGCLLINGKIVTASKEWWTLTSQEIILLCLYINSLPKVLSREVVIFLPTSSPQNSNRLITLHLLPDVEVCVLCSENPPLETLEEETPKIWKDCFDLLKVVSNLHPRNLPPNVELDNNILSLLLVNSKTKQSVCSFSPFYEEAGHKSKDGCSPEMISRQDALRCLYKLVVGNFFKNDSETDGNLQGSNSCPAFDYGEIDWHDIVPCEYYLYTNENKAYVIYEPPFQIFIIYNNEVPHYAMQMVSKKTLDALKTKCFPASC